MSAAWERAASGLAVPLSMDEGKTLGWREHRRHVAERLPGAPRAAPQALKRLTSPRASRGQTNVPLDPCATVLPVCATHVDVGGACCEEPTWQHRELCSA